MKRWLLLLSLVACTAQAASTSVAVTNAGFETLVVSNGTFTNGVPAGWSTYDPNGILGSNYNSVGLLNPSTTHYAAEAPEGSNVALIFLWPQSAPQYNLPAGIQQTLSTNLAANTKYTLNVSVGNIADDAFAWNLTGFPGYAVQLLAGGSLLSQDNNSLTIADGAFGLSTVQYTSGSSVLPNQALTIRLINLGAVNSGIEVNFDDVKLTSEAIPEPGTYALLACGLVGLALWMRRRKTARLVMARAAKYLLAIFALASVLQAQDTIKPNNSPGADLPAALRSEFFQAAAKGDVARATELLAQQPLLLNSRPDNDHRNPLIIAAWKNQAEMAKFLLSHGADIEAEDYIWGASALGWAGWYGHPEVAAVLIEAKAEVNHPNRGGATPLNSALTAKNLQSDDQSWKASPENYEKIILLFKEHGGVKKQTRTRPWPIVEGWGDPALDGFPKKTKE